VTRLLAIIAIAAAVLAATDPLAERWLAVDAARRSVDRRVETFRHVVFRNMEETQRSVNAAISRAYRRLEALPDEKEPLELRVVLIGNSAGLFAIAPAEVERRLAAAYPTRRVRLSALLIPDIGVRDERLLVRAALAKSPDLIVLLPNLKGLILGRQVRMRFVRELFGAAEDLPPLERPGEGLRRLLVRHWQLFRARDELRALAVGAVADRLPGDARSAERRAIQAAFAEIEDAASRRDVAGLLAAYRAHGLERFIPEAMPSKPVPRDAPIFRVMGRTAGDVQAAGVRGIAIFLPVNPLFRDPEATRGSEAVRVDDDTLRRISAITLTLYARAGFATADLLDALPPTSFIDLVHANAEGMRSFTEKVATLAIQTLQLEPPLPAKRSAPP
jgi:hypothetical protein